MDFMINGNLYLVKNDNKILKDYKNNEYQLLRQWMLFKQEPKDLKEINTNLEQIEKIIKCKIEGNKFVNVSKKDFIIPEKYTRYSNLLDNIKEI